jgi:pyrroline-5-carboxylate reductase
MVSDLSDERLAELGSLGVSAVKDNRALAGGSGVVFLCIKPQNMAAVLDEVASACSGKLVVSIAAGVTTKFIEKKLSGARVVRVMPNTPALVGELAGGYCLGKTAGRRDGVLVGGLLSSLGVAVEVPESLMDAVTGLSGSGPAYYYYIIDAFAKAGVKQGLSEKDALALAAKTAKGAAEMLLASGKTPKELIEAVCSPGGTTIEGMKVLEASDIGSVLLNAVSAATEKSRKLSK